MKYFLILPVLLFFSVQALAQNFTLETRKALVNGKANELIEVNVDVNNISGDTLYIKWKTLSHTMISGWDYSICDNVTCYLGFPDSQEFNPVPPGEKGFMKVQMGFNNLPGKGNVIFVLYNRLNPLENDTLEFEGNATPVGIAKRPTGNLSPVPNPAMNEVMLTALPEGTRISIYGMDGRLVAVHTGSPRIDISALEPGLYIVKAVAGDTSFAGRFIKSH